MTDKVAVARFVTPTSTGNVDWTTSELGGTTPKAIWIIANWAESDGVVIDDVAGGYGFADDTRENCCSFADEHDTSPTDTRRERSDTQVLFVPTGPTQSGDVEANFVAFIPDGVRLNFTDLPVNQKLYTVVFFAGNDMQVYTDVVTPGNVSTTTNVTAPGFQADLVLLTHIDILSSTSNMRATLGACTPGVQDVCYLTFSEHNNATTSRIESASRTDGCAMGHTVGGTLDWVLTSDTNANGFDLNVTVGNCNRPVHYLAIKFGDAQVKVSSLDSPTSTGNTSVTGVSFKPQAVIMGLTSLTAINTIDQAGAENCGHGISTFTDTDEYSNTWASEDGVNPTDTQSLSDNVAVNLTDGTGTSTHVGSLVSMDNDGFTINYTTANGTTRKWFYIAIELVGDEEVPWTTSITQFMPSPTVMVGY